MSGDEAALWTKLSTFAFDGADTQITFAARLARENGWSTAFTQRVIEEYRRFLFLCCVSPTGVTPSDPVDQAWHLHLTYTKSYWTDLCRNTLDREIHHNPTKGGASEGQKFNGMYSHSHDLYQHYFGEKPPAAIWHDNQQRFSDIDFERVNRRTNWIIRKPQWTKPGTLLTGLALMGIAALFFQARGGLIFLIFGAVALLFVALVKFAKRNESANHQTDTSSSDSILFMGLYNSDDNHDGHGDGDASDSGGDSGCSSSGCSSGCSGCGGGGD